MNLLVVITFALLSFLIEGQLFFGEIQELNRQVDITQRYVESQIFVNFKNTNNQAINQFYYAIPNELNNTLVHCLFENMNGTDTLPQLVTDSLYTKGVNYTLYQFDFDKRLLPGSSILIRIKETFFRRLEPLPKKITLQEPQYIFFEDNKYFFSPYKVVQQKVTYKTGIIKSYTEDLEETATQRAKQVKYGTYQNVSPFSIDKIQIHSENSTPLAYFKKATKDIEVSHWGNIAINSNFKIENHGAQLKGEFDRLNRQFRDIAKSALKGLHAELPYHAWGVSYGDEIGNISTSHAWRSKRDKIVHLDIKHRFPIVGGWRSNFNLGYNLNTSRCIYENDQNQFLLKQQFSYPFMELIAEDYELSVSLPQGAYDIDIILPFQVDNKTIETTHSYLDTKGRQKIIINKSMVSQFHNQFFYVTYKLPPFEMFRKPIILFVTFLSFFMFVVLVNRIDSTSKQHENKEVENEEKDK